MKRYSEQPSLRLRVWLLQYLADHAPGKGGVPAILLQLLESPAEQEKLLQLLRDQTSAPLAGESGRMMPGEFVRLPSLALPEHAL